MIIKILKTASGKSQVKISKSEWESMGRKAGWLDNVKDVYNHIKTPAQEHSLMLLKDLRDQIADTPEDSDGRAGWARQVLPNVEALLERNEEAAKAFASTAKRDIMSSSPAAILASWVRWWNENSDDKILPEYVYRRDRNESENL